MKQYIYIGQFPPPYGGVTIRNDVYTKSLSKYASLKIFNLNAYKNKYLMIINFMVFIFKNRKYKGIISTDTKTFLLLSKVLNFFGKNIFQNLKVITAGGIVDKIILSNNFNLKVLNKYDKFLVEILTLKSNLQNLGLKNVNLLPNCRNRPENREFKEHNSSCIKFISFSRICKEKGISKIIEAEKMIPSNIDFNIDFYGPIDEEIKEAFLFGIDSSSRMEYKGIFEGDKYPIYDLLKDYEVLLLPSDHVGEGYPGVIADSKIAGLTIISSDINDNSIIIKDKIDGVILEQNNPEPLAEAMKTFILDKTYLYDLRKASYDSAEEAFIDNYIEMLMGEKS